MKITESKLREMVREAIGKSNIAENKDAINEMSNERRDEVKQTFINTIDLLAGFQLKAKGAALKRLQEVQRTLEEIVSAL